MRTMNEHFTLTRFPQFIVAIITACALASCATYSKVSERRPVYNAIAGGTSALASANAEIVKALRLERRDPLAALGEYMTAAETASRQLQRNPQDEPARHAYNFAVGRIIGTIRDAKLDPWTQPLRVPASGGEFLLTHKPDPRPQWNPATLHFHASRSVRHPRHLRDRAHDAQRPRRAARSRRT